jgi:hypothetical protein
MGAPVQMIGRHFGRLQVVEQDTSAISAGKKVRRWLCVCECGTRVTAMGNFLRSGHTTSCGCKRIDKQVARLTTHGMHDTPTYQSWVAMRSRCTNPQSTSFKNYGGRGIRVCDRWMTSFEAFLSDMGEAPLGHQIDRIDNDGDYSPGNCKWSTRAEQSSNKRNSFLITINGETLTCSQWARRLGLSPGCARQRWINSGSFDPPSKGNQMRKQYQPAQDCTNEARPLISLQPVVSKQIASIGYDSDTKTLAVTFNRGTAIYHYENVEPDLAHRFRTAESIGSFFGEHIAVLPSKKFAPDAAPKQDQAEAA